MGTTKVTAFTQKPAKPLIAGCSGPSPEHLGRCVTGGCTTRAARPAARRASSRRSRPGKRGRGLHGAVPRGHRSPATNGRQYGHRDERPKRLDLAWHTLETNEFGLNEWARWLQKAGIDGMLVVNLGTRGVDAATALVEYCNHPGGSLWSDLRRSHGVEPQPHGFRMWGLGNELDGPWQVGSKDAAEYGLLASAAARAMKRSIPGSSWPWRAARTGR